MTEGPPHRMIGVGADLDADEPEFVYTIDLSLTKPGWPELIIVGCGLQTPAGLINGFVMGHDTCPVGLYRWDTAEHPIFLRPVDHKVAYGKYMFQALDHEAPVVQIVFSDPQGRFPWDDDCDERYRQPLLPEGAT